MNISTQFQFPELKSSQNVYLILSYFEFSSNSVWKCLNLLILKSKPWINSKPFPFFLWRPKSFRPTGPFSPAGYLLSFFFSFKTSWLSSARPTRPLRPTSKPLSSSSSSKPPAHFPPILRFLSWLRPLCFTSPRHRIKAKTEALNCTHRPPPLILPAASTHRPGPV
jgi:hypothetical protein